MQRFFFKSSRYTWAGGLLACSVLAVAVMGQSAPQDALPRSAVSGRRVLGESSYAERGSEIGKLLAAYRESTDEKERSRLTDELTKAVTEEFDARQKSREAELAQLEEQVRKLGELQRRRESEKTQIVADRVRQLVREADGLGWGGDAGGSDSTFRIPGRIPGPARASGGGSSLQAR
jgi:hypothetical protein